MRSTKLALLAAAAAATTLIAGAPSAMAGKPQAGHCARIDKVRVPGAETVEAACLDDLTTAGTVASGHTNAADWAGLNAPGTTNPSGVPGIQVDGYFPDSSTGNANNGWNHDSQFVLRLPDRWNGRLVVAPPPGNRAQYSSDFVIGDWVLAQGYAFASTDKGNVGTKFYAGQAFPGASVAEWNLRVAQLTVAAKATLKRVYAKAPQRTYLFGISNGGYQTRWQLENVPSLYDGGLDWEGTLLRADGPNLLTYLPTALKQYPAAAAGDQAAHDAMIAAGFEPGTEYLWPLHFTYYWDLTQRIYREAFDPTYDGGLDAGVPFCASGTPACDADYDYARRPASVRSAVRLVENTGRIGKPLVSVQGTHDTLLPIRTSGDPYDALVDGAGRGGLHRFYRIEGGGHTDGFYPLFPDRLRPLLPCARAGFTAMTQWVERGTTPPVDATYARPASGDLVNTCRL